MSWVLVSLSSVVGKYFWPVDKIPILVESLGNMLQTMKEHVNAVDIFKMELTSRGCAVRQQKYRLLTGW